MEISQAIRSPVDVLRLVKSNPYKNCKLNMKIAKDNRDSKNCQSRNLPLNDLLRKVDQTLRQLNELEAQHRERQGVGLAKSSVLFSRSPARQARLLPFMFSSHFSGRVRVHPTSGSSASSA